MAEGGGRLLGDGGMEGEREGRNCRPTGLLSEYHRNVTFFLLKFVTLVTFKVPSGGQEVKGNSGGKS